MLALLACSSGGESRDAGATDGPPPDGAAGGWRIVLEDLPGVVLSIWGTSADDLFVVGGTLADPSTGDPGEDLILHHDGSAWRRMDVEAPTLWWVYGFAHEDVWAVGEQGAVLHFDGSEWTPVEGGYGYTLWGVWGAAPNDLWAVGGTSNGSMPALIRRYDGSVWADVDAGLGVDVARYFKVWGTAIDDVFIVGEGGVIVHFDGVNFTQMSSGTADRLITVYGRGSDDVWAVGGLGSGVVLRYDGKTWASVGPAGVGGLMGLWTGPGSDVVVSGFYGVVAVGHVSDWNEVVGLTSDCLHGVWGDGKGTVLAGGGEFLGSPPRAGVIVGIGELAAGPVQE
ncbi:MAG: hypothetical protein AABZ30_02845 [Myxococcota bacterium]